MVALSLAIAGLVVVIDQVIKYFVAMYLPQAGVVTAIPHLLDLNYVENRGVAFDIFVVLSSDIIVIRLHKNIKKKIKSKMFLISSALIIGGGIGNLIDRVLYGYVIDYLQLSFFSPVCNFADYAVTVGTVLLVIYLLFMSDSSKTENKVEHS